MKGKSKNGPSSDFKLELNGHAHQKIIIWYGYSVLIKFEYPDPIDRAIAWVKHSFIKTMRKHQKAWKIYVKYEGVQCDRKKYQQ